MHEASPETVFVYSPFRVIDDTDRVRQSPYCYGCEGAVHLRHWLYNFVGNGSGLMVRRGSFERVGGFDERPEVIGCEDLLLQLRLAMIGPVAVVPSYLVGYRVGESSLSRRYERMFRTRRMVAGMTASEIPDMPPRLRRWGAASLRLDLAQQMMRVGSWPRAAACLLAAGMRDPVALGDRLRVLLPIAVRRLRGRSGNRNSETSDSRAFHEWAADDPGRGKARPLLLRRLAWLERLEKSAPSER
jgi:hypothetical protein